MTHKIHLWLSLSPLIVAFVLSLIILFFFRFLPERLPLFYSLPWGDRELATHQQFFIIPAATTLIALANLVISWQLHYLQSFFKKILLVSSLITTLILIITFIKIVLIFI